MQPQYPTMPQFPQQPAYPVPAQPMPQQGYPQAPAFPVQPQYAPQGYPAAYPQQYAQPQAPAVPLPAGSLDSFYGQPSGGGGPSFKFQDASRQAQIGKSYVGIVARPVTDADVRAQTDNNGRPVTYKDGRPKYVMVVPMQVQPSPEFPDGQAGWWVKGQARDELARAMAEAGAPAGPPEAGAAIRVTLVSTRPVPGYNPQFIFRVEYVRPQGAQQAPAVAPQPTPAPVAPEQLANMTGAPVVPAVHAPGATFTPAAVVHQLTQPMPHAAPAPMPEVPQQPAPAPVPQAAPMPAPAAAPAGFSPEQAALFAKLTGGQG